MEWNNLNLQKFGILQGKPWSSFRVSIDSRTLKEGDLFIALEGAHFDGHNFIEEVYKKGAAAAIVTKPISTNLPLVIVSSTYETLQNMARYTREVLQSKVIGITGSCGKTSTKEILQQLLSVTHSCYCNPGNFNNVIGLSLSLINAPFEADFIILEMGMSNKGEIAVLSKIAKPDIALITNIGHAHIEFFSSLKEIAQAKSEIMIGMESNDTVILNKDTPLFEYLTRIIMSNKNKFNVFTYGVATADFTLEEYNVDTNLTIIKSKSIKYSFITPPIGIHQVYNVLGALSIIVALNLPWQYYLPYVNAIKLPHNRGGKLHLTFNNKQIVVIDDSYNASPEAMLASLVSMTDIVAPRKIAILGDMLELGRYALKQHQKIVPALKSFEVLILIGRYMPLLQEFLPNKEVYSFVTSTEVFALLPSLLKEGDCILIKGSRSMQLENIISFLKTFTTSINI